MLGIQLNYLILIRHELGDVGVGNHRTTSGREAGLVGLEGFHRQLEFGQRSLVERLFRCSGQSLRTAFGLRRLGLLLFDCQRLVCSISLEAGHHQED